MVRAIRDGAIPRVRLNRSHWLLVRDSACEGGVMKFNLIDPGSREGKKWNGWYSLGELGLKKIEVRIVKEAAD